jgi:hypothetical protein
MADEVLGELFELEIFGGNIEKRYRTMRPEVEQMPWGTLDPNKYDPNDVIKARKAWTGAAFQEHRTGVACAATLKALIECRAPLDLIALATRFPLDEMVHVELCARMAMELGGGTEIIHDPHRLAMDAAQDLPPVLRAAELCVRFFCVGETLSIPLLRGTWKAAQHPLSKAVLGRIVKDEAAHGTFGWSFLEWALPQIDQKGREHLGLHADLAIRAIELQWEGLRRRRSPVSREAHALSWMETDAYLTLASRSMERLVVEPFLARGIPISRRVSSKRNEETGDRT